MEGSGCGHADSAEDFAYASAILSMSMDSTMRFTLAQAAEMVGLSKSGVV
jgi:hypothetical protein